jgi:glycosyltransferase involved in cell wall biosynthesis
VRILHLVSCRGWSSDAYWAARVACELERRGHEVTLGCRHAGADPVITRARREGVSRIETYRFGGGVKPVADAADLRRLRAAMREADVVHVHRGKEHWLAVAARAGLDRRPPIVRTRHIAQSIRPHAGNRWLYGRATALVVAVTEAIRGQCVAAGVIDPARIVTLHGGADVEVYRPAARDPTVWRLLGGEEDAALVGMIGGLRVMKGHQVVLDALGLLDGAGAPRVTFVGRGSMEPVIRRAIARAGLERRVTVAGFTDDVPRAMAALDVALYVPLESDGMSRIVFEYLASGRPLIASRVGAAAETLVDGVNALLVPAGDAEALADALRRLLGDAGLRARLADGARRAAVERYSGARVAEALDAHYARLLAA